jgi:hypothetical protein
MKKYVVEFEIFDDNGKKSYKTVIVEAGNKKIAALRAMTEINKDQSVAQLYKNLLSVREVA